ncbi:MAG: dTMP kinase [Desulfobulbaceae bacterium]|nr:dTMP kinase [Desulfobulbaceae bacterium]
MENIRKGILIAMEGIDGTGKSTQLRLLADYLRSRGCLVVETREPTDGPYGRQIRKLYVNRDKYTLEQELELFILDRQQHVNEVVEPALAQGKVVLTDRYYFSTAAYQGAAGMDPAEVFQRNSFAPRPDLVILLTMPPEVGLMRIQELRGEDLNDFEQEEQLRKVAELFASFQDPCIRRIPADAPLESVADEIRKTVDVFLLNNQYQCETSAADQ